MDGVLWSSSGLRESFRSGAAVAALTRLARLLAPPGPLGCALCGRRFSLQSTLRLHRCPAPGAPGPACTAPRGLHRGGAAARIPTGGRPTASAGASSRSPPPGPGGTKAALRRRAERGSKVKAAGGAQVTGQLIQTAASRTKLLGCRSCERAFRSTAELQLHRKEAHSREKSVLAPPRPAAARRRRASAYACPGCSQVFFHHLSLRAHCRQQPTCSPGTTHRPPVGGATRETPHGPGAAGERPLRAGPGRPRKELRAEEGEGEEEEEGGGEGEEEEEEEGGEGEFPCPSCAEVFSRQAQLRQHEELHLASVSCRPCSVCSGQVEACGRPGARRRRPYHCGPCLQGFSALDSFLEHCQEHLRVRVEEDGVGEGYALHGEA
ncbi:hypothetical protein EYF80_063305 [Liparis tanakae]|uniref:C2H2-type domain-containing protein n=1 Tax=Liparis tanakae TaxID=230148 RepID=A0A4Z2ECK4_9TELE|nr:hypothetical protein EYF80_063305 [Liparis tanakae]